MLPRLVSLLCLLAVAAVSPPLIADEGDQQAHVTANHSLVDTLKAAQATKSHVMVVLKGGAQYSARQIKDVSNQAVVLQGPYQKELYDVYVLINEIAAVEVKVRK